MTPVGDDNILNNAHLIHDHYLVSCCRPSACHIKYQEHKGDQIAAQFESPV
jgi:hypothetical protein